MATRATTTAETGERLLDTAQRHFLERPYEAVTLSEIAAVGGVTPQTLHARFGSKDELFAAAHAWYCRRRITWDPAEPTAWPSMAIVRLYDRYEEHGRAMLRMLAQEERIAAVRELTAAGRAYHRHWAQSTFAPLLAALPDAKARGRRLAAIRLATDLLSWKVLRVDIGLDRRPAERIVLDVVEGAQAGDATTSVAARAIER
jgi:AcrR family transcriptional regulator